MASNRTAPDEQFAGAVDDRKGRCRFAPLGVPHSPLRSRATSLIPFLSPKPLDHLFLAGTMKLLRGEILIMGKTLGISSALLAVPSIARPLRTNGDALSIRS